MITLVTLPDAIKKIAEHQASLLMQTKPDEISNEPLLRHKYDFSNVPLALVNWVQSRYPSNKIVVTNCLHYPDGGGMPWHTNESDPALRLYISYADKAGMSSFDYLDDKGIEHKSFDVAGVMCREFLIPKPPKQFWHKVSSHCNRFSFGFKVRGVA